VTSTEGRSGPGVEHLAPHRLPQPDRPLVGPLLFARYAFGPNRLGYCGPEDATELFEAAVDGWHESDLRGLARQFDGAWPYLQLIARETGYPDPLHRDVVEAYWLGSDLLDHVRAGALGASLDDRFRKRVRSDAWRWLAAKPADGAKPVHAFHVLDVFPRTGLLRSEKADNLLEVIDCCRIRWGRVVSVEGDWLVVSVVPVVLEGGRLVLGGPRVERVQAWRDGAGFVADITPGNVVSIHWSWACDRLDDRRLANLVAWTRTQIKVANTTV
jgi:Family of unknown function (DUF6390)